VRGVPAAPRGGGYRSEPADLEARPGGHHGVHQGADGSMPKLYPSALSDADVAAVAAYVMKLRKK